MSDRLKSGSEDVFITGSPQITFFKAVYRRHTNFAIEIKDGSTESNSTTRADQDCDLSYKISKNGHLLYRMWLDVYLFAPTYTPATEHTVGEYINWTNNTAHAYLKECKIGITGQDIDTHTGHWLDIYNEMNDINGSDHLGLNKHQAKNTYLKSNTSRLKDLQLSIPLQFWFCRNPGLALPIAALQKSAITLKLKLRNPQELVNLSGTPPTTLAKITKPPVLKLFYEIIHLADDEARRFIQNKHEYLIETLQSYDTTLTDTVLISNFSHPIKELIWVMIDNRKNNGTLMSRPNIDSTLNTAGTSEGVVSNIVGTPQGNDYFNYMCGTLENYNNTNNIILESAGGGGNIYGTGRKYCEWFNTCVLKLDSTERFSTQKAVYFRTTQPSHYKGFIPKKHIYSYSFALNPTEYTPSGSVNFTQIDNKVLHFTNVINNTAFDVKIHIFGINYNIFRIMSGMGSLIYSN